MFVSDLSSYLTDPNSVGYYSVGMHMMYVQYSISDL